MTNPGKTKRRHDIGLFDLTGIHRDLVFASGFKESLT
jgi:hypothetical protein